jgi:GT2 family glycosyltransferase
VTISASNVAAIAEVAKLMDASVVIPTKDRPLDLRRCLRALNEQQTDRRFEVIVVDDGSSPPIRPAEVEFLRHARVIRSEGVGPAAARNRGLHAALAPSILFTDDDTAPSPRWVESACTFLETCPDHVGVEGPTVSPPFDALYERSVQNHHPGAYWTCNVAYTRDALLRLGGFSQAFPAAHAEDLDLAFRALRLGPIGFVEDMLVTHFPVSVSMRDVIRRARYTSSDMILRRRHPDRFSSRLPLRLELPVAVLRYLKGLLQHHRRDMIGTPRRCARFSVIAAGLLAGVVATSLQPLDCDGKDAMRIVGKALAPGTDSSVRLGEDARASIAQHREAASRRGLGAEARD